MNQQLEKRMNKKATWICMRVFVLVILSAVRSPAQVIVLWPGAEAPKGWHFCDGSKLARADHTALFEAIGHTYGGSGDEFALPDLRAASEKSLRGAAVQYIISDGNPGTTLTQPVVGEITLFASNFEIRGFAYAEGQRLDKSKHELLYDKVLGSRFAYKRFASKGSKNLYVPDFRTRIAPKSKIVNDGRPAPSFTVRCFPSPLIALSGIAPDTAKPDPTKRTSMEPFLAQVVLFAGEKPPRGWATCGGQLLRISQYDALFSLLGTIYGGDGRTTFGVPNMTRKDKLLKKAAGLKESSPRLFHMIAIYGIYPSRL